MKKTFSNIIFGRHPVLDAIAAGKTIDKILLQTGTRGELEKEIRQLSRTHNFAVQFVPKERLSKFAPGNHQGIVAFVSEIPFFKIEDIVPAIFEKGENPLILILEGVTDVRNFGAIARSAEVCGAHAIVIPTKGSAQINADAVKTSAGALMKIPVCKEPSLVKTIEYLQQSGIQIMASDLQSGKMIYDLDFTTPVAIIVGAEDEGVSRALLKMADGTFIIPQKGTTDSLNVSVATGIMLYEALRQRR